MLAEIRSDVFRKGPVIFRDGLNVILGDENATNSIGKSTLLMIIDFAFGGGSLLEHNTDLVAELGDHYYFFTFKFLGETYVFRRGTNDPSLIYRCTNDFTPSDPMIIEDYTAFLKAAYCIAIDDISFRSLVGLYMRIWGKENLDVHRPLHVVHNQGSAECVNTLIRAFGRYEEIRDLTTTLARKEKERVALNTAFQNRIVPKIGKKEHKANSERMANIESEIEEIKVELAKFATNIGELVNREVLELKIGKDRLLADKLTLESKLLRIRSNLQNNRQVKSANFDGLLRFFPSINREKVLQVEEFHNRLVGLLRSELRASEEELQTLLQRAEIEISEVDTRLGLVLKSIDQPSAIVDRVYALAIDLSAARQQNEFFDIAEGFKEEVKSLKGRLTEEKEKVIELIERQINDELRRIVTMVFGEERKSPKLDLRERSYVFEVFEDTGTGIAYAGLITFDLAIFSLTQLPAIIHDSILFKNIENDSVAKLFKVYAASNKQSFVAIDEIAKYGKEAVNLLRSRCALQLSNNSVLFMKDWRKK